ncbi:HNH endonuclease family protein [Nocardia sp. NBC_00403]|uniref:HNH endonuclease family protein n=1 Tax=Nocardia sp. NBC_00403 TaxID=2975990 RepID=UPI002E1D64E8
MATRRPPGRSRPRRFLRSAVATLALLLCVAAAAAALWITHRDSTRSAVGSPSPRPSSAAWFPPGPGSARALLNSLTVGRDEHWESYARNAFGPGWAGRGGEPVQSDGCTARDAVLRRDLHEVRMADRDRCMVLSGRLDDPYTGTPLPYNRFKASDLEIDHVVPLGDAWRSGAWDWPADRRERLANDIDNLVVVQKQANRDKGSKSPDRWRPPRHEYWCEYARRWVGVKARYGLHVTPPERDALGEMLDSCPAQ